MPSSEKILPGIIEFLTDIEASAIVIILTVLHAYSHLDCVKMITLN
jgi:hypothetical protein